jgi:hypothetical protein
MAILLEAWALSADPHLDRESAGRMIYPGGYMNGRQSANKLFTLVPNQP